ncbi:succinate dehydrogenase assembly factor 2 [Falsirhodobacter algicola]|uniref:FAD assembly factor SdhE n=1 Tax=Falsirhodobacter algicola TaxID=2692330 RepID=A0A8J8SJM1_9RHOB|nr:succinate dehydrogenase assembly factor 2 [Falsirhodobacter algicola]QUS34945.1 succinate dehydrogenase assembly factor 2 [Falsirhodobacter algicola]
MDTGTGEAADARLKRLSMRSWRRGMKEMDLVLGPWSDTHLSGLTAEELDQYELLLEENDQDLLACILGRREPWGPFAPLLATISGHARTRWQKA